ncbi:MAG: TonB-dependent receptor [Bacteroidota bacterium]
MNYIELSPERKSFNINMDNSIFGSFAEIGGGQETARFFFQAGGASHTIAKTISAYDMALSDNLYGKSTGNRYVSQARLKKMLTVEFDNLTQVLTGKKDENVRFFAFANTVSIRNFKKTNESHGWLGCKFQLTPQGKPNEVIMHVRLLENEGLQQQATLGVLGVNFLYACYYYHDNPTSFIKSLTDSISDNCIEITMLTMYGNELDYVDNRLLGVQLVKNGLCPAIIFDRNGLMQQPSDMLYKKDVLAFRGSFRPITYTGFDILRSSYSMCKKEALYSKENTLALCEITLNNLLEDGKFDERDFLERVDILNGMGQNVMISNFKEYYRLVEYFSLFQLDDLRIIMGADTLEKVMDECYYAELKGGILEAFGKLFANTTQLYIYPSLNKRKDDLLTSENIRLSDEVISLYDFLLVNKRIIDLEDYKTQFLDIHSSEVLELIQAEDNSWEKKVPVYIAECIKKRNLFGYKNNSNDTKHPPCRTTPSDKA